MRKEYRKAVCDEFTEMMRERFSLYLPIDVKAEPYKDEVYIFPGDRIFCYKPIPGVHCYVILHFNPRYDDFMVAIGWSKRERFPHLNRLGKINKPNEDNYANEEEIIVMGDLCGLKMDGWAVTEDTSNFKSIETVIESEDNEGIEKVLDMVFMDYDRVVTRKITAKQARDIVRPVVLEAGDCLEMYGIPYLNGFIDYMKVEG